MDLRSIQVQNYKSIHDSGRVTVEPDVTCMVGKNESGKTALLEALYRLKPVHSGHAEDFDPLRDYPRRLYGRDKDKIAGMKVIEAAFELSEAEVLSLERQHGEGCLTSRFVTVTKGYDGERRWTADYDLGAIVKHVKADDRLTGVNVSKATTIEQVRAAIEALEEPPAPLAEMLEELATDPRQRIRNCLKARLPSLIYFSQYSTLPGAVSVERLQNTAEDDLDPGERTALSLLKLAGVDSEEFDESNYEARKAALEAAANTLTDEVFEYWTQNTELQVELDIEFRPRPNPEKPEPFLQIRIRNNRHRVTLNFSERSAGFVWFFSFLAFFSEFRNSDTAYVLLLDEPGLNLHGTAQADLLRYIDEQLAREHQVVYSTHSPFMVQADRLERARLVEDIDREGTIVRDDALGTSDETQFPLHAAIGINVTQTLFLGPSTLIVEGNSDLLYLKSMSRHLASLGKTALDERWTILPVGGLDKMPTFMALLTPQVYVVALHDVPNQPPQKLQNLVTRGIIKEKQLVPLTKATRTKEADIEDLFSPEFYADLLRASGIADLDAGKLTGTGRLVPKVEALLGRKFSHYAPARHLAGHDDLVSEADEKSVERFDKLFTALNALLPSE